VLVDLRNALSEASAEEAGFDYYGIGRKPFPPINRHEKRRKSGANGMIAAKAPSSPIMNSLGCPQHPRCEARE